MSRDSIWCLLLSASVCAACTGYAVYSDETWYGMNFDYPPESEILFNVSEWDELTVFSMSFHDEDLGGWIPTVAMNEDGLFASLQYQCPMIQGTAEPLDHQRYLWQLFGISVAGFSSVDEAEEFLERYHLVNLRDLTLHLLLADAGGRALIAEAGEENQLTWITGEWIVMTNFKVADVEGIPIGEIEGVGDDRYRRAIRSIKEDFDDFGVMEALGVLEDAVNIDEVWGTEASMVFSPSLGRVYICIDGDFQHVWEVSMTERTIQPFCGEGMTGTLSLGEEGITATQLLASVIQH